jgi:hypothetical protein
MRVGRRAGGELRRPSALLAVYVQHRGHRGHSILHYSAVSVHRRVPAIGLGPQSGFMRSRSVFSKSGPPDRRPSSPPLGSSLGPARRWHARTLLGQHAGAERAKPLPFPSPLCNLCALCASVVLWANSAEGWTQRATEKAKGEGGCAARLQRAAVSGGLVLSIVKFKLVLVLVIDGVAQYAMSPRNLASRSGERSTSTAPLSTSTSTSTSTSLDFGARAALLTASLVVSSCSPPLSRGRAICDRGTVRRVVLTLAEERAENCARGALWACVVADPALLV